MGIYIKINGKETSTFRAIVAQTLTFLANSILTLVLWNAVMPGLGVPRLNLMHAYLLWMLCRILFTGDAIRLRPSSDV